MNKETKNKIFSAEIAKVILVNEVIREYSKKSNSFINGLFP